MVHHNLEDSRFTRMIYFLPIPKIKMKPGTSNGTRNRHLRKQQKQLIVEMLHARRSMKK
jgi:hypothetical protein